MDGRCFHTCSQDENKSHKNRSASSTASGSDRVHVRPQDLGFRCGGEKESFQDLMEHT